MMNTGSRNRRLHVLAFTSLFRTPSEKVRAPFTSEFLRALKEFADVTLVCPIPWAPDIAFTRNRPDWARFVTAPRCAEVDGVQVHYTRYPMIPKLSGVLQPTLQAWAAWSTVRAIHQRQPVDVVNGRFVYPDGVAAARLARRLGVPYVLTALGTDINIYATQRLKRGQAARALQQAAHVTAVSPALADRIAELGVDRGRIAAAVNGIDLDRFRPDGDRVVLPPGAPGGGRKTLLTVARLSQEKGLHVLVDALGLLARQGRCDFHTVLVGDGPERAALQARLHELGLHDRVTLAGEVDHAAVPAWLRGAAGFCLPSFREGTPNVVIEALATGIPVTSTNVGGTPLLLNDSNGLLVEPGQAEPLAQALHTMMSRAWDRDTIRRSVAHMSWRSEAERHAQLFERIACGAVA
jgi:teichuronic acid biosynthesis glycosyltransferase TuaC